MRISKAARADMRAIFRQSAEMFGLSQADAYVADLHSAFDLIATFPQSGRESRKTEPPVRILPRKAHIILYALDDQDVLILRVRHAREDWLNDPLGHTADTGGEP
ncbi:type II toxin-antitoxin system RelE/ParE family toxin [uncultured Brevundimonas sp.]|uniref:type II toxin-antitoxin system RelE/ParE family toxin n=1 Tax=uncultured Brevundimonas sp. TaxID=213418 RepID=UPI0025F32B94|nr:type II toxin-antitoxin system RelE/ParE family toxin [uncultured Brevundimonas sp.]